MKRRGRVTHLPLKTIPKRRFIPVTNPGNGQKSSKTGRLDCGWWRVMVKNMGFMDLVAIPVFATVLSTIAI